MSLKRSIRRNTQRNIERFRQASPSPPERLILPPLQGPPVREIERYPLGDYLYDRAKAAHDLARAKAAWFRYKLNLPDELREQVEKVERLFRTPTHSAVKNSY